ncbi:hypothetical protein BJ742DRAFT_769484 [Cladochytrium replicatum]|nr:hypothetical protein BJ742DRAFT_769484 [Cladochytrium replicatum]
MIVVEEFGKENKKMEAVFRRLEDKKSAVSRDAPLLPSKCHSRRFIVTITKRATTAETSDVAELRKDYLRLRVESRVMSSPVRWQNSEMAGPTASTTQSHLGTRQSISHQERPGTAIPSANLSVPKSHRKSSTGSSIASILSQTFKFGAQTPAPAPDLSTSASASKLANMIEGRRSASGASQRRSAVNAATEPTNDSQSDAYRKGRKGQR